MLPFIIAGVVALLGAGGGAAVYSKKRARVPSDISKTIRESFEAYYNKIRNAVTNRANFIKPVICCMGLHHHGKTALLSTLQHCMTILLSNCNKIPLFKHVGAIGSNNHGTDQLTNRNQNHFTFLDVPGFLGVAQSNVNFNSQQTIQDIVDGASQQSRTSPLTPNAAMKPDVYLFVISLNDDIQRTQQALDFIRILNDCGVSNDDIFVVLTHTDVNVQLAQTVRTRVTQERAQVIEINNFIDSNNSENVFRLETYQQAISIMDMLFTRICNKRNL